MQSKGYSYTIEEEKILEYMKLTTEQKLQWLEENNEFTFAGITVWRNINNPYVFIETPTRPTKE